MRSAICYITVLAAVPASIAYEVPFDSRDTTASLYGTCSGMWAGQDTFINVAFDISQSSGKVELLVFEASDYKYLGRSSPGSYGTTRFCYPWAVERGDCAEEEIGHYLFSLPDGVSLSDTSIWTARVVSSNRTFHAISEEIDALVSQYDTTHGLIARSSPQTEAPDLARRLLPRHQQLDQDLPPVVEIDYRNPIQHSIHEDGYYCVLKTPVIPYPTPPPPNWPTYKGTVIFHNTFPGRLPAAEYLKLLFYLAMFSLTSVVALAWTGGYLKHRKDVLPQQRMMSYLIAAVELDMLVELAYYTLSSIHGQGVASVALHFVTEVVHAARNTITLLVLLLLFRGSSVLREDEAPKPLTQGSVWLFSLHLLSGVLYAWGKVLGIEYPKSDTIYELTIATQLKCSLIILVPTTIICLSWILSSWIHTLGCLALRGQRAIQRKYVYSGTIFVFAFAVYLALRMYTLSLGYSRISYPYPDADQWQLLWLTDGPGGWREIPYFPAFVVIALLWRPSEQNSKVFAYEEISQDEHVEQAVADAATGEPSVADSDVTG